VLIATCSSDWIVLLRRGPHSAVTPLRVIPLCESSFLEVHLAQWGNFLGANSCAPPSSHSPWECIYLSYVPCTWFSLGVALSWVVSVPGSPNGGAGTSWVRLPPTGTRRMVLKPPFSSLYYCSKVLRPLAVSPPPRSFLPMGIGG